MSRLRMALPAMFVVVHQTSPSHAVDQARVAFDNGADGVFLINHYGSHLSLGDAARAVRADVGRRRWIGVNPLGLDAIDAARFARSLGLDRGGVNGLWCDNARIDETEGERQVFAARVADVLEPLNVTYFGGVAFKYQRDVADLEAATAAAAPWMDVICTSGPGTGQAADLAKLERMAAVADQFDTPLAVASGLSIDNAADQLAHISAGLVATSVSINDTTLDGAKIAALAGVFARERTPGGTT